MVIVIVIVVAIVIVAVIGIVITHPNPRRGLARPPIRRNTEGPGAGNPPRSVDVKRLEGEGEEGSGGEGRGGRGEGRN